MTDDTPAASVAAMVQSPGSLLFDQLTHRRLWIRSVASATGLDVSQIEGLLTDRIAMNVIYAQALARVLKTTPRYWMDAQHASDLATLAGEEVERAPEAPEWMRQSAIYTHETVSHEDAVKCVALGTPERALDWWLSEHQVFTIGALQEALSLFPGMKTGDKSLGMLLHRIGYHSRKERYRGQFPRVWRWNPDRIGKPADRLPANARTFDDISDEEIEKSARYKDWRVGLLRWTDENPVFTLEAIIHVLGLGVPYDVPELKKNLRRRGFTYRKHVWARWPRVPKKDKSLPMVPADPLTATCPRCGQSPGTSCTTTRGGTVFRNPHQVRVWEAVNQSNTVSPESHLDLVSTG